VDGCLVVRSLMKVGGEVAGRLVVGLLVVTGRLVVGLLVVGLLRIVRGVTVVTASVIFFLSLVVL